MFRSYVYVPFIHTCSFHTYMFFSYIYVYMFFSYIYMFLHLPRNMFLLISFHTCTAYPSSIDNFQISFQSSKLELEHLFSLKHH